MHASQAEKNVFGHNVKLHLITKMPIEQGIGARPDHEQAQMHCDFIERDRGKEIADAIRAELKASDVQAAADAKLAKAQK